ncbi:FGGY carbohydrate kinase domain-containing protein [Galendromus occidentalis]|uniref:FGGY carbohydrate kinase domain-containing protein n=1 Tax=Galendromus occidentalis TaxID=34638 RepID=A0AAJ6QRM9_9ACAR|nr:FGGY carbohydrate kinase domain-containing protein [Galendromus occidentalis]
MFTGATVDFGSTDPPAIYDLQLKSFLPSKKIQMATSFVIGVDVGSRSARAALVTLKGNLVRKAERPLIVREEKGEIFEQSSNQIWEAVCECVREVASGVGVDDIKGIGFDATCSLVVTDSDGSGVSVSVDGDDAFNVIMWCDHRASEEAATINKIESTVLSRVGGKISPEMEPPKLLWLKKHMPQAFARIKHAFDLPDYLTYRASGSTSRSLCSLACKWTYHEGWNTDFWREIGLPEVAEKLSMIGTGVQAPGAMVGCLSESAAHELGLSSSTRVGHSIIDAHAGVLGMLGVFSQNVSSEISSRLCIIAGTSTCHMLLSDSELFVQGVWGPYAGAIIPDMYLAEAGQSAAGMLLDHVIASHPRHRDVAETAQKFGVHIVQYLTQVVAHLAHSKKCSIDELTRDLHVYPDFHGNRSPLSDPSMRGMISGLQLSDSEHDLALLFLATVQALAYSTKHIVSKLESRGHRVDSVVMCGGLVKNPLYVTMHANVLQKPVLIPEEPEAVLLGAAMLGARASGCFEDLRESVREMSGRASARWPDLSTAAFHSKKYRVYQELLRCQMASRVIMSD